MLRKESGEMEGEMIRIKSRENDGKVKFMDPKKVWDEDRKLVVQKYM